MDLFGKRRIAELEKANANLNCRLEEWEKNWKVDQDKNAALRTQVEYLVRTIRDMDQEIYNMGQRDNWPAQRPHFQKLHDEMTARKVAESNRIGDILRPQLIDTYKPDPTKAIGKLR